METTIVKVYLNIVVPKDMGTSSYQHLNFGENPAQARFKAESHLMHTTDLGGDVVATLDIGDINEIRERMLTQYHVHIYDPKDLDRGPESRHLDPAEAKKEARILRSSGADVWVAREYDGNNHLFWHDPQNCESLNRAQLECNAIEELYCC